MLIRTTAPVAAVSGKQGQDIVFFSWRGSQCARDYARPTNPNTAAQQSYRNILSQITKRWKTLTAQQRADWATYAAANKVTNRLGVEVTPTALGAYLGIASLPKATSDVFVDDPPNQASPAPPTAITDARIAGTDLEITVTHGAAAAGESLMLYAYKPASVAVRLSESVMAVATFPANVAFYPMDLASTSTVAAISLASMKNTVNASDVWHFGARIVSSQWAQSRMTIASVVVTEA